jgi:hypothetical protein
LKLIFAPVRMRFIFEVGSCRGATTTPIRVREPTQIAIENPLCYVIRCAEVSSF